MENKAPTEPSGVLLINKPQGFTSHDVINKIRRLYGTRRVGHTGTLDPLATGVLVVLVGRAAKAAEYLVADKKEYLATLRLGLTTDTEDITGEVLSESEALPNDAEVHTVAKQFWGEIMQTPPMYSALKVGGQKLCDLARKGIEVERAARAVTIHSLEIAPTERAGDYTLRVVCSSGTYIRTLCADIGKALGTGGVMATLCRTAVENFRLENSFTLEQLEAMDSDARIGALLPIESLFSDLPCVCLVLFYEKLSRSGCEIYQKKIKTDFPLGTRVRMCTEQGHFYALGEVMDFENGTAIKAVKMFEI